MNDAMTIAATDRSIRTVSKITPLPLKLNATGVPTSIRNAFEPRRVLRSYDVMLLLGSPMQKRIAPTGISACEPDSGLQRAYGWLSAPAAHRARQAMTTASGHQARNSRQGFV